MFGEKKDQVWGGREFSVMINVFRASSCEQARVRKEENAKLLRVRKKPI